MNDDLAVLPGKVFLFSPKAAGKERSPGLQSLIKIYALQKVRPVEILFATSVSFGAFCSECWNLKWRAAGGFRGFYAEKAQIPAKHI